MHRTPFDQIQLADKRDQEFQMLGYFLVGLLRACENKGVIPHIHADHIRVLQESEEVQHYEAPSQVIF